MTLAIGTDSSSLDRLCKTTRQWTLTCSGLQLIKAGQIEFAVYRHCPHGFSFQISDPIQSIYTPSNALISGRGLGNLELKHSHLALSTSLKFE